MVDPEMQVDECGRQDTRRPTGAMTFVNLLPRTALEIRNI
jgi:hypothetical protein